MIFAELRLYSRLPQYDEHLPKTCYLVITDQLPVPIHNVNLKSRENTFFKFSESRGCGAWRIFWCSLSTPCLLPLCSITSHHCHLQNCQRPWRDFAREKKFSFFNYKILNSFEQKIYDSWRLILLIIIHYTLFYLFKKCLRSWGNILISV
jgi:hypothetical protein